MTNVYSDQGGTGALVLHTYIHPSLLLYKMTNVHSDHGSTGALVLHTYIVHTS